MSARTVFTALLVLSLWTLAGVIATRESSACTPVIEAPAEVWP